MMTMPSTTARRRSAAVALLLVAVAVLSFGSRTAEAINVNGGYGCRFYSYRKINTIMRKNGQTNATVINAAIESAKYVNGYLCTRCDTTRMQIQNVGGVVSGRGECWCKPGFGWSQEVTTDSNGVKSYRNWYGCTKCIDGTTTSPVRGPYRPGSLRAGTTNRWTDTACA